MKKKSLVIGSIAAATVLAGGWAFAQAIDPGGFGPPLRGMGPGSVCPGMMQRMHWGMGPGMMFGGPGLPFADPAQIEWLKKELGLTTAQESEDWAKYTKALQDAATAMKTAREGINPDAVIKLSPQERFAFVTKIREEAQKQFETVKTAANELLTTLNETQKAKAQDILPGLAFGPGAMQRAGVGGPPFRH